MLVDEAGAVIRHPFPLPVVARLERPFFSWRF